MKDGKMITCPGCNKEFYRRQHYLTTFDKKHCSTKCRFKNLVSDKAPHWKGGKSNHQAGYTLIRLPIHITKKIKRGGKYSLEHRLVMEQFLGRKLSRKELVHHINDDKRDNRIENLQIMSRPEHAKHHNSIKKAIAKCYGRPPWNKGMKFPYKPRKKR